MKTMRAVITSGHGGRDMLKLVEQHPRKSLLPGQVELSVSFTSLNFHDIFTRRGMPGIRITYPIVTGSDIAGTISALGSRVNGWSVGDRVLVDPLERASVGIVGETSDGGRAEFTVVDAAQLVKVPDNVPLDCAAALPLAYGTAHRMLFERGRLTAGEIVLILGASGGVGVACLQLAKMAGCTVIACASSDRKIAILQDLGADYCLNYHTENLRDAVHRIVGKPKIGGAGGVDVAVNFTGGATWIDTQKCVKQGGRVLNCGATAGFIAEIDLRYLWTFEHQVIGSNAWSRCDLITLLDHIAAGLLTPFIDRILPLDQAAEAERLLEDREVVGKVLLVP